jgi:hypothetical protein
MYQVWLKLGLKREDLQLRSKYQLFFIYFLNFAAIPPGENFVGALPRRGHLQVAFGVI